MSKIDEPADGGSSDDEEAWQRFKASDNAFKGMGDGSGMSMLKPGDFAWKNDPYQGRRAPGGGRTEPGRQARARGHVSMAVNTVAHTD